MDLPILDSSLQHLISTSPDLNYLQAWHFNVQTKNDWRRVVGTTLEALSKFLSPSLPMRRLLISVSGAHDVLTLGPKFPCPEDAYFDSFIDGSPSNDLDAFPSSGSDL